MEFLIVAAIGLSGGFLSGLIGGGAGLMMIPALLLVGLSPHTSIATTRFGSTGLMVGSLLRFLRSNQIVWRLILPFMLVNVPASFLGAYLVIIAPANVLETLIALVMIVVGPLVLLKRDFGVVEKIPPKPGVIAYSAVFVAKTLQASLGTGIGLLVNYVYIHWFGLTFNQANALKRTSGIVTAIISIAIFAYGGIINYQYGFVLLVTMFVGGYLGSHMALKAGNQWVKYLFVSVVVVMGIALLLEQFGLI